MNFDKLEPENISDIVFRMDEYLSSMREMKYEDASKLTARLENYIRDYFSSQQADESELKTDLVKITDMLYVQTANIRQRDLHTDGYFGIVLNRLFWNYQQKGILAFYILDNSLRDYQFKLVSELFKNAGFEVIAPYNSDELSYSENTTELPVLSYKEVEKQIDQTRSVKRHIFYIEKDSSVNYIKNVLALGEEFQSEYLCIFRNTAPDGYSKAAWLMGSFANYLDNQ